MEANSREFLQFSDQIRLRTASLSIGDSIWSDPFVSAGRRPADRRNIDSVAASNAVGSPSVLGSPDLNAGSWKLGFGVQKLPFDNSSFDRYTDNNNNNIGGGNGDFKNGGYFGNNGNGEIKNYFNKAVGKPAINNGVTKNRKKNANSNSSNDGSGNGSVDKRFKTLPSSEALPRSEAVGGYIFVCNNDTMHENLKRQLFGLPPRYRDSVRAITPGLPLFLYNYSTHQLHGIFEASSFGGTNIDPAAWEDKKCPGESRFPAQVKVVTRKICEPLEEDSFRPILHHYDGPKFRLELSVPEALALLDIFTESCA